MIQLEEKESQVEATPYASLAYTGIKGKCGMLPLSKVTIVTGPNESGKTAIAEAIRLAATGTARIGNSKQRQGNLFSSQSAMASILIGGKELVWNASKRGESVSSTWAGEDYQGGLPVSVKEFWELTAEKRWDLIAGDDDAVAASSIVLDAFAQSIDKIRRQVSMPRPLPPERYVGDSLEILREREAKLAKMVSDYESSVENIVAKTQAEVRNRKVLEELTQKLEQVSMLLADTSRKLRISKADLVKYDELLAVVDAAYSAMPKSIQRFIGQSSYTALKSIREEYMEAVHWLKRCAEQCSNTKTAKQIAVHATLIEDLDMPTLVFELTPPTLESQHEIDAFLAKFAATSLIPELRAKLSDSVITLSKEHATYRDEQATLQRQLDQIHNTIAVSESLHGPELSQEEYEAMLVGLEDVRILIHKAEAYAGFTRQLEERVASDAIMQRELTILIRKQCDAKMSHAQLVRTAKGWIEDWVNKRLASVGMAPISLVAETTGKRASLTVTTAQYDITALADSRQLIYGALILAAIHEHSTAAFPLLVIEAAELEPEKYSKLVEMLLAKEKGCVVIAHWSKPSVIPEGVEVIEC